MPSEPIKEGYKVFALCDTGYTYDWLYASRSESVAGLEVLLSDYDWACLKIVELIN